MLTENQLVRKIIYLLVAIIAILFIVLLLLTQAPATFIIDNSFSLQASAITGQTKMVPAIPRRQQYLIRRGGDRGQVRAERARYQFGHSALHLWA
jgi:hypothetical protein